MKVLDLFSGIGGFSLGLERAGMETVAFCEFDKNCREKLTKRFPGIPIYEDIRRLYGTDFEAKTIDLICGGFPCQPWSVAGKCGGHKDDRDLWPQMFRVITEIGPRWVIGENVSGFANYEMGLKRTISDLEGEGYEARAFNIPACAVGAPHERKRIWIIAHSASRYNDHSTIWQTKFVNDCKDVSNSKSNGIQRSGPFRKQKPQVYAGETIFGCDRSGGRTNHWTIEPGMGRVANGVPGRVDRLKQLGNAVVPQVVEIIGRAIMEIDNEKNP